MSREIVTTYALVADTIPGSIMAKMRRLRMIILHRVVCQGHAPSRRCVAGPLIIESSKASAELIVFRDAIRPC